MWSRQNVSAKLRITKFSSEGMGGNSAKFCTSENFPLHGITQCTEHLGLSLIPKICMQNAEKEWELGFY